MGPAISVGTNQNLPAKMNATVETADKGLTA